MLRSIDRTLALRMIGGMTQAIERAFDELDPDLVMTFTIDRYVMDVMERTARARGIDFLEMTTSIIPDEVMLMRRGRPVWLREPSERARSMPRSGLLCKADFAPAYVRDAKRFSTTAVLARIRLLRGARRVLQLSGVSSSATASTSIIWMR